MSYEGFDFGDEEEWGDSSRGDETNTTLTPTDTLPQVSRSQNDVIYKSKGQYTCHSSAEMSLSGT